MLLRDVRFGLFTEFHWLFTGWSPVPKAQDFNFSATPGESHFPDGGVF